MKKTLVFVQIVTAVAVLLWIIVKQGNTITQQRDLIREMSKNPYCMVAK